MWEEHTQMFRLFGSGDPLRRVEINVKAAMKASDHLARLLGASAPPHVRYQLSELGRGLAMLQRSARLRQQNRSRSDYHMAMAGVTHINVIADHLSRSLRNRRPRDTRLKGLLREVLKAVQEANSALRLLEQQREAARLESKYMPLRDAIRKLNRPLARRLSSKDLEQWVRSFSDQGVELTLQDPTQRERMARLIVLACHPEQIYEILYRSSAPGRPLVPLIESGTFPSQDELDLADEMAGGHRTLYVAARLPTWRLVWTFYR